jgi:uncharacterized protein (DUF885 family)
MRRLKRLFGWLALILLIGLAVFLVPTIWFKPWSIDHFYARVFFDYALKHPMTLTSLGILEKTPIRFYADDLDDFSIAFEDKEQAFLRRQLGILRSYDKSRMSRSQALSADVMESFMAMEEKGQRFRWHNYPVNQMAGIQSGIPEFMMSQQPLKTPRDAEDYVKRIGHFGRVFDQFIEHLDEREKRGVLPPRFVLDKVIAQVTAFIEPPAREHPLFTTYSAKLDTMPKLTKEKRAELENELAAEIENTVYPAYERLHATLEKERAKATTDDGVWKLPEGDAYYDWCLESHTTTTIPADSIHALGLREIERIQSEMRRLLSRLGYPTKDLPAAMKQIESDPRYGYPEGDSGRTAIITDYQSIIDDADQRSKELFNVRPKFGVQVKRVPEFREKTAPGAYYQPPSIGGSRPGTFYTNLRDVNETRKPGMRTLAYHEAIPGHHFQITIAQELQGLPFFRRVIPFTAYSEGWGLYAERLGIEYGFHPTATDSLGAYQAELFRAVRLVVDTGIHRKRWTRESAIQYMVQNTGIAESEVTTEIERYIVMPGQACAYKVGQIKILELRQRAMDQLGPRFDIKRFHDAVLTHGSLPLNLLERVVDEWIAAEQLEENAQRAS